jgi:hypothetical protein
MRSAQIGEPQGLSRPYVGQSVFAEAALRQTTPSASRYMSTLGRDSEPANSVVRASSSVSPLFAVARD